MCVLRALFWVGSSNLVSGGGPAPALKRDAVDHSLEAGILIPRSHMDGRKRERTETQHKQDERSGFEARGPRAPLRAFGFCAFSAASRFMAFPPLL